MSDNNGGIWFGALFALILYAGVSAEGRGSPCVYSHNWMTDLVNENDQKRTCSALLKESNSRLEAQQARINALTEQVDALHVEPATASETAPSIAGSPASSQEAPTLSAEVGSEVAHADEDQDD